MVVMVLRALMLRPAMPDPMQNQTPAQALLTTRILWAALLIGPLIFVGIASQIFKGPPPPNSDDLQKFLPLVVCAFALVELPVLYLVRGITFKKNRENDAVTPRGFLTGNLMLFAGCEGLMLFAIVTWIVTRIIMPTVLPGVLALLVMLVNFPTGRAMYADGAAANPYNPDAK